MVLLCNDNCNADHECSDPDAAEEGSIVHGATSLLRTKSLYRAVSRQSSALAGLGAGLTLFPPARKKFLVQC